MATENSFCVIFLVSGWHWIFMYTCPAVYILSPLHMQIFPIPCIFYWFLQVVTTMKLLPCDIYNKNLFGSKKCCGQGLKTGVMNEHYLLRKRKISLSPMLRYRGLEKVARWNPRHWFHQPTCQTQLNRKEPGIGILGPTLPRSTCVTWEKARNFTSILSLVKGSINKIITKIPSFHPENFIVLWYCITSWELAGCVSPTVVFGFWFWFVLFGVQFLVFYRTHYS